MLKIAIKEEADLNLGLDQDQDQGKDPEAQNIQIQGHTLVQGGTKKGRKEAVREKIIPDQEVHLIQEEGVIHDICKREN